MIRNLPTWPVPLLDLAEAMIRNFPAWPLPLLDLAEAMIRNFPAWPLPLLYLAEAMMRNFPAWAVPHLSALPQSVIDANTKGRLASLADHLAPVTRVVLVVTYTLPQPLPATTLLYIASVMKLRKYTPVCPLC